MKKVSVLIVTINTKNVLKLCLENLRDIYPNLEVIVADNSSTDGTFGMLTRDFPWVKTIHLENNGLSAGLNACLKEATGDFYLYMGSDAFPNRGTIEKMVDYMERHPDTGGISVKLLTRDGKEDPDAHRGFPSPWVSFTHFSKLEKLFPKSPWFGGYFLSYKDFSREQEIDACITHFLFVKKEAQDKVGLWDDKNFFLYGEDIDFCFRLKEAGYKLMYLPYLSAEHWKGVTVGVRKTSQDVATMAQVFSLKGKDYTLGQFRIEVIKFSTDAMEAFFRKHYAKHTFFPIRWVIYAAIRVMKLLRVTKQKFVNWKKGIK